MASHIVEVLEWRKVVEVCCKAQLYEVVGVVDELPHAHAPNLQSIGKWDSIIVANRGSLICILVIRVIAISRLSL